MTEQAVDVLIVGAGPSRAVAAHTLASRGFSVLCLEQGDWVDSTTLPGNKPEFELLNRTTWSWDGNKRGRREDYPLNIDESDTHPMMFAAVGGSSVIYGAHWQRLLPSDFRVRSLDGVADDWPISYDDVEPFYVGSTSSSVSRGSGATPPTPSTTSRCPPIRSVPAGLQMARGNEQARLALVAGHQRHPERRLQEHGPVRPVGSLRARLPRGRQGVVRPRLLAARHRRRREAHHRRAGRAHHRRPPGSRQRRHLGRRRRQRAPDRGQLRRPGRQRHWHPADPAHVRRPAPEGLANSSAWSARTSCCTRSTRARASTTRSSRVGTVPPDS